MISVAIPAYKSRFLRTAIRSVLSQSFEDFELIILNDGSPDPIGRIVGGFSDGRIRYYENTGNIGGTNLVRCWNQCLSYARGRYFVLFSDDDRYQRDFLLELHRLAVKHPGVHAVHCRVRKINEKGETLGLTPACPEVETALDFMWHAVCGRRKQYVSDFMYRTATLRKTGGFFDLPLAWGSDYVTSFRMAALGGIAYTPKILFHWRKSGVNLSASGDVFRRLDALDGYRKWMEKTLLDYSPASTGEKEKREKCLEALPEFFGFKRQWLLNQMLSRQTFAASIVRVRSYSKTFRMPPGKILFRILQTELSRMNASR
jgi:glycosyltransferase involved in cell wall biosynthesis